MKWNRQPSWCTIPGFLGAGDRCCDSVLSERDVVRRVFILLMISFFVSACAIKSVGDFPVRSPKRFLKDVKVVVDSSDLENVEFVRNQLRIDCGVGPREPLHDGEGSIEGYRVDVKCIASSKEYDKRRVIDYGLFWPVGADFYRAGLSLPIDGNAICVTPYDLLDVFGDIEKYPVSHWNSWAYMYKRNDLNSRVVFSVGREGCVGGVHISMNRERK